MLGLPDSITACLFDMDGVITKTAVVHATAWKQMFDEFLKDWYQQHGQPFKEFDKVSEYDEYVDGKPRLEGTASFLESRNIKLPMGTPGDTPGSATIYGLGNRKNELIHEVIERDGVAAYEGSVRYVQAVRAAGLRTAIVSSSANTADVLEAADVAGLFDARVDHQVAEEKKLRGKPAPDTFLEAARQLGVANTNAAVFEDALAGVSAGKAGNFGYVVGIDRTGQADELKAHGATVVVQDLAELL